MTFAGSATGIVMKPPRLVTKPLAIANLRWLLTMASTARSGSGSLARAFAATSVAESKGPLPSMPTSSNFSTIAMALPPVSYTHLTLPTSDLV